LSSTSLARVTQEHHLRAGRIRALLRLLEVVGDADVVPLAALGLVGGGDDHVGAVLVDARVADLKDGRDAVVLDQVDHHLQVAALVTPGRTREPHPSWRRRSGRGDWRAATHQVSGTLSEALDLSGRRRWRRACPEPLRSWRSR
jgi:hypothetical protein